MLFFLFASISLFNAVINASISRCFVLSFVAGATGVTCTTGVVVDAAALFVLFVLFVRFVMMLLLNVFVDVSLLHSHQSIIDVHTISSHQMNVNNKISII